MKRYLIVNPFGIGDVLFTTPVIKALKRSYPDCFIGYWCNERVAPILRNDPNVDKIFPLSRGDVKRIYRGLGRFLAVLKIVTQVKKERFDVSFDFSLDSRYGLWSKLAGIKKRIGFDYKNRGRFLTDGVTLSGYSGKHVIEHNLDLLKFVNIESKDNSPEITVSETDKAKAANVLREHGVTARDLLVGVAPGGGASWGGDAIYKQWPAQKFAGLVSALIKRSDTMVLLLGSREEKPLAGIITGLVKSEKIVDLTGKLSLNELAGVMSQLKLLACNDGGLLHMAAALGIGTVSIFGPVDEVVYGPYPPSRKHKVVKADIACRPCYKDFRFTGCNNDKKCLGNITVEKVLEEAESLL